MRWPGLNEVLWAKAAAQKLLRMARVRTDTTVIGAPTAKSTSAWKHPAVVDICAASDPGISSVGHA